MGKRGKAAGVDGITYEHIQFGGETLNVLLAKLFSSMLKLSYAPTEMKRGVIITLFKGGNKRKDDPDNYRALTLSSVILKLFERILLTRIQLFDNIQPPIHPLQGGFQKHFGCLMTSFMLRESIYFAKENGSRLYVCFLDVRKAFDCVWHDGLFYKLYKCGVNKSIFKILQNLYTGMSSCVRHQDCKSDWFPILQGTRQGGVISPFLYLIFLNDLLYELEASGLGMCFYNVDLSCPTVADDMLVESYSKAGFRGFRGFRASSLSTYDFSTLYTTLPHNLIKDKLVDLIERTFQREGSLYIACNDRNAFFTSDAVRNYNLWSCQKVCEALTFLLDNIYIRFGSKLYRQIVGIPMGTNCAPLVADLFLFCYERDFMLSLSEENQSGIIEAFNSTSRYLDDVLNIDNNFFDSMVNRINPSELQLNKANVSDAEASFLDLHLSISDGFVKTKIYDKRDDFDFDIVNFPFLDGDVPRSASYGVYISQLIRFARVSSHVDDFNTRNKVLTAKLLRQGYRYHKLRKAFSKFYRRHFDIVSKYNVGLKTLLLKGLSEPEFYGDLVYKFRKIIGKIDFPYHFKKIIVRYKKIGYNINVMRQTACLVVNPIKVNSFAYLFNCTTVGRTSD